VAGPQESPDSSLRAVAAISATDVWAVGRTRGSQALAEHWDGTRWSVAPGLSQGGVLSAVAAVTTTDVWAVGQSNHGGPALIEHWDGKAWSVVPSPSGTGSRALMGVAAISSTDVWAVGQTNGGFGATKPLAEHWDGTAWRAVPVPATGYLRAVAALSATDVWAVGYTDHTRDPVTHADRWPQALIAHWDGKGWRIVPAAQATRSPVYLFGLAALSARAMWSVGAAWSDSIHPDQAWVEHWDGTAWRMARGTPSGYAYAFNAVAAVSADDVWAVGNAGSHSLIGHWDGACWGLVP
jgi:hypothetical protein